MLGLLLVKWLGQLLAMSKVEGECEGLGLVAQVRGRGRVIFSVSVW